jgi:hypothetical protein
LKEGDDQWGWIFEGAALQRENCAKLCEAFGDDTARHLAAKIRAEEGGIKTLKENVEEAVRAERNRCAKIADSVAELAQRRVSARQDDYGAVAAAQNIAAAIRGGG